MQLSVEKVFKNTRKKTPVEVKFNRPSYDRYEGSKLGGTEMMSHALCVGDFEANLVKFKTTRFL
jgi:hypothetical protein